VAAAEPGRSTRSLRRTGRSARRLARRPGGDDAPSPLPAIHAARPADRVEPRDEEAAKKAGYQLKVGKFPFSASGKAKAAGASEGFVKLIFDAKYGELLGAHMIGYNVTEMIAEIVVAKKLETTGHEMIKSVHPHPTMSEATMEAAAAAYGEVIHL
jgi:hypothetical protein